MATWEAGAIVRLRSTKINLKDFDPNLAVAPPKERGWGS
jgi:hypothetical protein